MNGINYCNGRENKAVFTSRPRLITLNVSHSVRMRVVAREERVMTQRTEASAARDQPVARFRGELQRFAFAATPLARRYMGCRWQVVERHLKQEEQTPTSASLRTTKPWLRHWHSHILTKTGKLESAIREHNFTSQHVIFEYNNSKSSSLTLYLRKEPLAANCTDVCCLCCQETWTKQETMPMMAAQHLRQPLPERSSCFKTISSDRHKENCRSVCEGDCFCLFVCLFSSSSGQVHRTMEKSV